LSSIFVMHLHHNFLVENGNCGVADHFRRVGEESHLLGFGLGAEEAHPTVAVFGGFWISDQIFGQGEGVALAWRG